MSTVLQTTPDTRQRNAAASLQRLVPELVAVTLDAKQAHWNVTGPGFLPLHGLADELAADARTWTDRVAERALALGVAVDGRAAVIARTAREFPGGYLTDREVIGELTLTIEQASDVATRALPDLEHTDPVGYDIVIEVLEGLGKYRWMLQAQRS